MTPEVKRLRDEILAEMETHSTEQIADTGVRVGLAIAARILERGRRLSNREKMENLFKAIEDYDTESNQS